MPRPVFTRPNQWRMTPQLAPTELPSSVSPPYQTAHARMIGGKARRAGRFTKPAKGDTTARKAGSIRKMNIPTMPKRTYSRSIAANAPGVIRRRPNADAKNRRPNRRELQ